MKGYISSNFSKEYTVLLSFCLPSAKSLSTNTKGGRDCIIVGCIYLDKSCLSPLQLLDWYLFLGEVYSIQLYVIQLFSDVWVSKWFSLVSSPIKLTITIRLKYCWKRYKTYHNNIINQHKNDFQNKSMFGKTDIITK